MNLPPGLEAGIASLQDELAQGLSGSGEEESSGEDDGSSDRSVTDSESDTEVYKKLVDTKTKRRRAADLVKKNEVGETKLHSVSAVLPQHLGALPGGHVVLF